MDYGTDASIRLNSDDLRRTIKMCEEASNSVLQILHALRLNGQSAQEWASDAVSIDMAGHYSQQLWAGAHCTYSAMNSYHKELLSVTDALQQILVNYTNVDGAAEQSMEQL